MSSLSSQSQVQTGDAALAAVKGNFDRQLDAHAEFAALMDSVEPATASREEILDLMGHAPTDMIRGYLLAIHVMRLQIAGVSGRAY